MTGNDIAVLLGFLAAAIALAGFAGIVTSIDRSAAVASNEVISFRVRNLVTSAVALVFLALLPVLLDGLELFQSRLWRRCCAVSAVAIGALLVSLVAALLSMKGGKDAGLSRSLFVTNVCNDSRSPVLTRAPSGAWVAAHDTLARDGASVCTGVSPTRTREALSG